jgi:hypothetical protein
MSNNKQAQLIKGYWVVETNKWNANIYTKEQAEKYADTLINCTNCINCSYCINCHNCLNCRDSSYCHNCRNCLNCSYCHDCRDSSYCRDCHDCYDCIDFKENPERITTSQKIGSRHQHTTYYWTKEREQIVCAFYEHQHTTTYYSTQEHEQIVCGFFKGSLLEFEEKVKETHGDNQHGIDYKNWIQKVKLYKGNEQQ